MKKNTVKATALAMLTGGALFGGGCLGLNWQQTLWQTALYTLDEFLLDNDGIFDLFEDGNVVVDAG